MIVRLRRSARRNPKTRSSSGSAHCAVEHWGDIKTLPSTGATSTHHRELFSTSRVRECSVREAAVTSFSSMLIKSRPVRVGQGALIRCSVLGIDAGIGSSRECVGMQKVLWRLHVHGLGFRWSIGLGDQKGPKPVDPWNGGVSSTGKLVIPRVCPAVGGPLGGPGRSENVQKWQPGCIRSLR